MNTNKKLILLIFFFAFLLIPAIKVEARTTKTVSFSCFCHNRNGAIDCRYANCTADLARQGLQNRCGEGGTLTNIEFTCRGFPGSSPEEACQNHNNSSIRGDSRLSLRVTGRATCQMGVTVRVGDNFCDDAQETMRFLGYLILFIKILIPFVIIFMGSFDMFKTVTTGKEDDMKKQFGILMKRMLAGMIIFFIPTFLNLTFQLIGGWTDIRDEWEVCATCLLQPSNCD